MGRGEGERRPKQRAVPKTARFAVHLLHLSLNAVKSLRWRFPQSPLRGFVLSGPAASQHLARRCWCVKVVVILRVLRLWIRSGV